MTRITVTYPGQMNVRIRTICGPKPGQRSENESLSAEIFIDHLRSWSPLSPRRSVAWTSIWGWCRCQRPRSTLVLKLANPKCVLLMKKLQRPVPQRCVLLLLLAGQLLIIALTLPYLDSLQHVDLPLTATDLMSKPCDAWSTVHFPKTSSLLSSTRSSRVEGRPACFVVFKGKMLRSSSTYWMRHVTTLSMSKDGLAYLSFDSAE